MASRQKARLQEKMIRNQWTGITLQVGRKTKEMGIEMGSYCATHTPKQQRRQNRHVNKK